MSPNYWPGSGARYDDPSGAVAASEDEFKDAIWSVSPVVPDAAGVDYSADNAVCYTACWPQGTFQQVFQDIYQEAFDLLVERQKKYGPKNIESQGIFGVFTRLCNDKIERIKRALNGRIEHGEIVLDDLSDFGDESAEDALLDIANYALIMLALKRGKWGAPLA